MAEPEVRIAANAAGNSDDVTMQGGDGDDTELVEIGETAPGDPNSDGAFEEEKPAVQESAFFDYLRSPVVNLIIGQPPNQTLLTAHEALLTRSPYFSAMLSSSADRAIVLPDEDLQALTSTLEYLYTNEYHPHKPSSSAASLALAPMDSDGSQLLRHARVYTLASLLELPQLAALAHSKIHLISSTAQAELAYARYVYSHTSARTDAAIRRPVASFWGQRSHVLRHETEEGGFRAMCLEFPEFAFDVLSFVLDVEEKRERRAGSLGGDGDGVGSGSSFPGKGSARKRARAER